MKKFITIEKAGTLVKSGSTVMIGGFLKCGCPVRLIDELIKNETGNLTMIANDTSLPDSDRGKLVVNNRLKKVIVTHIGTNPETGRQMQSGQLDVELVPMGTLAERIRAAGAGLGGILTKTGLGTVVAEGKKIVEVDGENYIFEKPLKADIALIYGTKADQFGNLYLTGTTKNFNTVMATAADTVIAEVDEISDTPLNPDEITIPGVFVDYVACEE